MGLRMLVGVLVRLSRGNRVKVPVFIRLRHHSERNLFHVTTNMASILVPPCFGLFFSAKETGNTVSVNDCLRCRFHCACTGFQSMGYDFQSAFEPVHRDFMIQKCCSRGIRLIACSAVWECTQIGAEVVQDMFSGKRSQRIRRDCKQDSLPLKSSCYLDFPSTYVTIKRQNLAQLYWWRRERRRHIPTSRRASSMVR